MLVDIESRAVVDIDVGAHAYGAHPWTQLIGFSVSFHDAREPVWIPCRPGYAVNLPVTIHRIRDHLSADLPVFAFNAMFDRSVWNAVMARWSGWMPQWSIEQTRCLMTQCRYMGIPSSLDAAARFIGAKQLKDKAAGDKLIRLLCRPRAMATCPPCDGCFYTGVVPLWNEDAKLHAEMAEYGLQDNRASIEVLDATERLPPRELALYHTDQEINDRGIRVDLPLVMKGLAVITKESTRLNAEMVAITGGAVNGGNCTVTLRKWLNDYGVPGDGVDRATLEAAMEIPGIQDIARRAMQIRLDMSNAAVKKLLSVPDSVGTDHRLRGMLNFMGAHTFRWTGSGFQPHNVFKAWMEWQEIDEIMEYMARVDVDDWIRYTTALYGGGLSTLANCIRGMLIPAPGHLFIDIDYSSIEARNLAYLAGEQDDLEVYRTHGKIYEANAAKMYRVPIEKVTKEQRFRAKQVTLGCGFMMGAEKFIIYAAKAGLVVTEDEAKELVGGWRASHPHVVKLWKELNSASHRAVLEPGTRQLVKLPGGQITFAVAGSFLVVVLPDGGKMFYPQPSVDERKLPWGGVGPSLSYQAPRGGHGGAGYRVYLHGGMWAENIIQRQSRDIMADDMHELNQVVPVVLTVHDSILFEAREEHAEILYPQLVKHMETSPEWAPGLPLKVSGQVMARYRK